jgi:hypothetical protein
MIVASNSLSDCTGGNNTILVESDEVVEAQNRERPSCALVDFEQLIVDALFIRIWDECVHNRSQNRPFPMCNLAYDEVLGYPERLDTYLFAEDGEYRSSITIRQMQIFE